MLSQNHRRLYGSLTTFQESQLDPCSNLEHQTWPNNQSQHDLLYGGVSLPIGLNLKLAPVPYATGPQWSIWQRPLFCLSPSHRAPRAFFFFLPSLPMTQRVLCRRETGSYVTYCITSLPRAGKKRKMY